jgi:hypothetical protein
MMVPGHQSLVVSSDPNGVHFWDFRENKKSFSIRNVNPLNQGLDCQELLMVMVNPEEANQLYL